MDIEQIKKKYKIATDDLKEIEIELLDKIKVVHPDNNPEQPNDFAKELSEAIDFVRSLRKEKKQMMVPVDEIIRVLAEVIKDNEKQEVSEIDILNRKLDESIVNQENANKKYSRVRRWSSVVFLGIFTFLWTLPKEIIENPVIQLLLSGLQSNDFIILFSVLWFFLLFCTGVLWLRTINAERIEKEILNQLKSVSYQNEVFMCYKAGITTLKTFSKINFMDYIFSKLTDKQDGYSYEYRFYSLQSYDIGIPLPKDDPPRFKKTLIRPTADEVRWKMHLEEELLQNAADIILLRAQEKGLIEKVKSSSLIDVYKLIPQKDG